MVGKDDRPHALEHRHVAEEVRADGRVRPHLAPLALIERTRLAQHRLGHADRADVVEQRAELDLGGLVFREAEPLGDSDRQRHGAGSLLGAIVLLCLKRSDERADDGEVRFLEAIVGALQHVVHRFELGVAGAHLAGLGHVQAEAVPGDPEGQGEDEDPEDPEGLRREGERRALRGGREEVHRHPGVIRAPDLQDRLPFRERDDGRGEERVHQEVREGRQRDRSAGRRDVTFGRREEAEDLARDEGARREGSGIEGDLHKGLALGRDRVHRGLHEGAEHPDPGAVQDEARDDRGEGHRDRRAAEEEHRQALGDGGEAEEDGEHERVDAVEAERAEGLRHRHESDRRHGQDVELHSIHSALTASSHDTPSQVTVSHATVSQLIVSQATVSQLTVSQLTPSQLTTSQFTFSHDTPFTFN